MWGIVTPDGARRLVQNPDFKGYNKFSWTNHKPTKKSPNIEGKMMAFLNLLLTVCLLGLSVVSYIYFKSRF